MLSKCTALLYGQAIGSISDRNGNANAEAKFEAKAKAKSERSKSSDEMKSKY